MRVSQRRGYSPLHNCHRPSATSTAAGREDKLVNHICAFAVKTRREIRTANECNLVVLRVSVRPATQPDIRVARWYRRARPQTAVNSRRLRTIFEGVHGGQTPLAAQRFAGSRCVLLTHAIDRRPTVDFIQTGTSDRSGGSACGFLLC